jgi:hypothetical protein
MATISMATISFGFLLLIFLHFILLFCILIALMVIAGRSPQRPRGFFVHTCPFCRERNWSRATVCSHCGRDLPIGTTAEPASPTGSQKAYRGYTYVVAANGEAELQLS